MKKKQEQQKPTEAGNVLPLTINEKNIYRMLHEFRNWNREWDLYMVKNPKNADEFVAMLAKKYEVTPK